MAVTAGSSLKRRMAPTTSCCDASAGSGRCGGVEAVAERVERVRPARAALGPARRLLGRNLARVDTALLAGADAHALAVGDEHDGVGLHVAAEPPGQLGVAPLGLGRLAL